MESEKAEKQSPDSQSPTSENEPSAREIHGWKWCIAVGSVLWTTLLFSIDNTVTANIQPLIVDEFGDDSKLAWLGVAFALADTVTILPWSKAYGVYDVKWLFITNVIIFEVGSAICGAAPTMDTLIVGRAIAGLSGGGIFVGCMTYLSLLTTIHERPVYVSMVGLIWGLGTILGPILGGAFGASSATWRWAFYINLVLGAVSAPGYLFLMPSIHLQSDILLKRRLFRHTDWLGIVLWAGWLTCLIMAITFGGNPYDWSSGNEISLWVMAGVLFICFCLSQKLPPFVYSEYRVYPVAFLRRRVLLTLQVLMFCSALSAFVATYYIPLYFQFAKGGTAISAAVHILPFICFLVGFALLNGSLMSKLGYYMPWYLFGSVLMVIGASLMHTLTPETSPANVYGYIILIGAGTGAFLQASFPITQALVSSDEIPSAVGFISIGQSLGILLPLTIAGAIFQGESARNLAEILTNVDSTTIRSVISGTNSPYFKTLPDSKKAQVIGAIVQAIDDVYILIIAGGALAIILSCTLPRAKLFVNEK